ALVALGACCLPAFIARASLGQRLGAGLIHGGAGLLVAAEDLGSLAIGVVLVGVGRAWVLSELPSAPNLSARTTGWRAGRETVVGMAAAIYLTLIVAAEHQSASRGEWSSRYDQLAQVSFPAVTQLWHLALLLLALAPGLSLWPF